MTHKTPVEKAAEVQRIEEQIEYLDSGTIPDNPPPESRTGFVKHNADRGSLEVRVCYQNFYEIDLDQRADPWQLADRLGDLAEKTWITGDLLADIMDAWSSATGKQFPGW